MEQEKIKELQARLDALLRTQEDMGREFLLIRQELSALLNPPAVEPIEKKESKEPEFVQPIVKKEEKPLPKIEFTPTDTSTPKPPKQDMEQLIGGNLLNKVGIAVLLLGIGVGIKYASDHNLIGPLMRIVLGYVAAAVMGTIGYFLKKKHDAFSATLVSGALASLYLITFLAHSYYAFYSVPLCFALMFLFTVATVATALWYNREIIAVIGLVGAYAVPVLLSDGSGRVIILFSYIAVINTGILFLSYRKAWKGLNYAAFIFTWIAYLAWFVGKYQPEQNVLAFVFATIFFLLFYLSHMWVLLLKDNLFKQFDGVVLIVNAVAYFLLGLSISEDSEFYKENPILFCLWCALLHGIAAILIYWRKRENTQMLWFATAMSLACAIVAVPLQYDGTTVTWLWTAEATALIMVGRFRQFKVLELLGMPLALLSLISMLGDWSEAYGYVESFTPLMNKGFASSLGLLACFAAMLLKPSPFLQDKKMENWASLSGFILIALLYLAFALEVNAYYQMLYQKSGVEIQGYIEYNLNYRTLRFFWLTSYTLVYCIACTACCIWWWKKQNISFGFLMINIWLGLAMLFAGLFFLSELRDSYLGVNGSLLKMGGEAVGLRYLFLMLVAVFTGLTWKMVRMAGFESFLEKVSDLWLQFMVLAVLSSELLNIMALNGHEGNYRFGLSILWGVYGLIQLMLGFIRNQSHWRIGGLIVFGVTLVKLFLYDILVLGSGAKTIAFISLGILLLAASFLYSRFKDKFLS